MLVLALIELGTPETVEAQVAFHRAAGVDLVLVPDHPSRPWPVHEAVRPVPVGDGVDEVAAEHGAAWILEARSAEFCVPRGGSLADVLAAVPADVGAIQAIERRAAGMPSADSAPPGARRARLIRRPGTHASMLRGWFPVEIVTAEDARVVDVLRSVAAGEEPQFPRPSAVDDPSFGIEVAASFEDDLLATSALLAELETRVARLEAGGLRGRAMRLARRARGRG